MNVNYSDNRKSGIALIGDIPWGTSLCQFYQTKADLLDILVPYFKAGLENNEFCIWVTSEISGDGEFNNLLAQSVPNFSEYVKKGQFEVISYNQWITRNRSSGESAIASLDRAIFHGFNGLRLGFDFSPENQNSRALDSLEGVRAIHHFNVIDLFIYPRDEFDAIGLMEMVKNHRYSLIRNNGKWEVMESSETRVAREALARSEGKLQSLFSHMAEGFAYHRIVLDEDGQPCDYIFLEVNEAFENLVGLKGRDIIGKRVTQVLPGIEKDSADWIDRYGKVALAGAPESFESYSEVLHRWYSVSAFSPHKGFFAAVFSDITEKRSHEEELLKAKNEWERTFNSVPDLIVLLDNQHRVIRANKAMADRLGMTPDQCIGARCYEVVHSLHNPPGFCPHSQTCRDGQEHLTEVHEPHLGGYFLVSTTPIFSDNGRIIGSIHVARDITERKRAEEALKRRTVELEASNKELEAFSYSVSHDLRAPLRSMDGFSQAVLEDYADKLDEQGKEWLANIRNSSQRMAELIDDILGLSRVVRAELRVQPVNLSQLAESIAAELQASQPEHKVDFKITPGLVTYGDTNLLRIALNNLLGNAFKFTANSQPARIEFGKAELEGQPYFFIKDNGAGFDMIYADKLFKAFQRLHTAEEFPGTGIGLATVQRIIHRHGGKILARGEVGKGAIFYFSIDQKVNENA